MKETIAVLQEDIDNSHIRIWDEANPLSIAMMREWGSFHVVNLELATMVNTEIGRFYKLAPATVDYIENFKNGCNTVPAELEIEFVDQNFYKQFVRGQPDEPPRNTPAEPQSSPAWSPSSSGGPKDSSS